MRRHEFSEAVRKKLAQDAMYVCSSPTCLRFTGYGTSEDRPRTIAQAAHINAAGTQGPRAKKANSEFLKSAKNGIWLCSICHKKIDDDPNYYSETMLKGWKKQHQAVIRRIVGKDLESALLDLRNHKRHHEETRELLSFLENKRVMYEGMDHEFPPRVLDSLQLIRERIIQTRARINPDTSVFVALNQLQRGIDSFLRDVGATTDLRTLRCDSGDPKWLRFSEELVMLRKGIAIIAGALAKDAGYSLSWLK